MNPLVSVIVPIYNGENYIEKCVKYLTGQIYQNLEILLIDDGSLDRSLSLCNKAALRDKRIRVIHQENAGVSASRNRGVREAKGEFILFFDVDDALTSNTVKDNVEIAVSENVDVVIFCFQYYNVSQHRKKKNGMENNFVGSSEKFFNDYLLKTLENEVFNAPWNKLIRRELLLEHDVLFDKRYRIYEDIAFNAILFKYARSVAINSHIYYTYYLRNAGTALTGFYPDFFEAVTQFYHNACSYCAKYRKNEKQLQKFSEVYVNLVVMYIKQISMNSKLNVFEKKKFYEKIIDSEVFDEALGQAKIKASKRLAIWLVKNGKYKTLRFLYDLKG